MTGVGAAHVAFVREDARADPQQWEAATVGVYAFASDRGGETWTRRETLRAARQGDDWPAVAAVDAALATAGWLRVSQWQTGPLGGQPCDCWAAVAPVA